MPKTVESHGVETVKYQGSETEPDKFWVKTSAATEPKVLNCFAQQTWKGDFKAKEQMGCYWHTGRPRKYSVEKTKQIHSV